jgi:hypothetical protein
MGAIFGAPRDRVAVCEVAITSLKANEAANIETAEEIREAYKVGGRQKRTSQDATVFATSTSSCVSQPPISKSCAGRNANSRRSFGRVSKLFR